MSNLVPAQIRLDSNQLNQLINSNLQINLSQLQQNQRENVVQNKNVLNINRNVVQLSQNQIKMDNNSKISEERDTREEKMSSINGSNERLNNSMGGKANMNIEMEKPGIKLLRLFFERPHIMLKKFFRN